MENNLEQMISLGELIDAIKKNIWLIMYSMAIGIFIAAILTLKLEQPTYQATSTVIMSKDAATYFVEDKYTKSDIDLYQQVGNTYIEIAKSNRVIDSTVNKLLNSEGGEYMPLNRGYIRQRVSASYTADTLIISFTATSKDRSEVSKIANAYCQSFIDEATSILPAADMEIVDEAETPTSAIASKILFYCMVGCILAMTFAVFIVLIKMFMEQSKLQSAEQINKMLDVEVLVIIK